MEITVKIELGAKERKLIEDLIAAAQAGQEQSKALTADLTRAIEGFNHSINEMGCADEGEAEAPVAAEAKPAKDPTSA